MELDLRADSPQQSSRKVVDHVLNCGPPAALVEPDLMEGARAIGRLS